MTRSAFAKPWYLYRPSQAFRRASQLCSATPSSATVRVAWGDSFDVNPRETIGASIWTTGIYDLSLSEALVRLVPPKGLAVDVGANLGYATCLMARLVGAGGVVWSYEPNPSLRGRLSQNVQTNGYVDRVRLRFSGVSDHAGVGHLVAPTSVDGNDGLGRLVCENEAATSSTVELVTLNEQLEGQSIDLLKADVEGHEASVLRGASSLLSNGRIRDVIFEEHGGRESDSVTLMTGWGYSVFELAWTAFGPQVGPLDGESLLASNEAPTYVATRDPERLQRLVKPRGFRCLSKC